SPTPGTSSNSFERPGDRDLTGVSVVTQSNALYKKHILPKTGDTSNTHLWLGTMIVSAAGLTYMLRKRMLKKHTEK
ncbi:MAG: LPXTG cell wall anchor domain-containing protein, partial [Coriobacteriia bacterium]|nr:LPXTG cell wall anchor domain-containing protein [Coriobacteriia bacterium]